jgi:hypothetical protein
MPYFPKLLASVCLASSVALRAQRTSPEKRKKPPRAADQQLSDYPARACPQYPADVVEQHGIDLCAVPENRTSPHHRFVIALHSP